MKIIDMRFRPGVASTIEGIARNPLYQNFCRATGFASRKPSTLSEEVDMLCELGVEHAVVTGRDVSSSVAAPSTNPGMLEAIQAYPEYFTGFYGIDPLKRMGSLRDFRRMIREYGVRGASIDPAMSDVPVDSRLYYPFYAACCEEGVPIAVTTGCSIGMPGVTLDRHEPSRIDRVATDFPELIMLVSHGGYPWIGETLGVVMRHENLWLDFSACTGLFNMEEYVRAANTQLMDKIVFASAHPFDLIAKTLEFYDGLPFSQEARKKVMHDNAARLLGKARQNS